MFNAFKQANVLLSSMWKSLLESCAVAEEGGERERDAADIPQAQRHPFATDMQVEPHELMRKLLTELTELSRVSQTSSVRAFIALKPSGSKRGPQFDFSEIYIVDPRSGRVYRVPETLPEWDQSYASSGRL